MNRSRRRDKKVRLPRNVTGRIPRLDGASDVLTCLVLASLSREWIGVDLASCAFVRVANPSDTALGQDGQGLATPLPKVFDIVSIVVSDEREPLDPARPEAIEIAAPAEHVGRPRRRSPRRLLSAIAVGERRGATLLGTRGPSLAYVDIDPSSASVELVPLGKRAIELREVNAELRLSFSFGGIEQSLPLADEEFSARAATSRGSLQELCGFRPSFLVVGLGAVHEGHVRKLAFGLLPARAPRRRA